MRDITRLREKVREVFQRDQGKLEIDFQTVMAIPNYHDYLEDCIDTKLARLHKDIQTQHQWRFEAVDRTVLFPLGCKTTFKAYSSDIIIEFEMKPKKLRTTPIGMSIGLEAHKVYNTWQPEPYGANSIADRQGIEGFFLIKKIPNKAWKPLELIEGSSEVLKKTFKEIQKEYVGTQVLKDWEDWFNAFAPDNDDVNHYLRKLNTSKKPFLIPLNSMLSQSSMSVENNHWKPSNGLQIINPDFEYPAVLQAAMNSVVTEFTTRPHLPRLTAETDRDLQSEIEKFEDKAKLFYDNMETFPKTNIIECVQRLVSFDGMFPSVAGSKKNLLKRIMRWGTNFVSTIYRDLGPAQASFVQRCLNYIPTSVAHSKSTFCSVGDVRISHGALPSLKTGFT